MMLIREAENTSALFMGDGAAATIEVLLVHNEEPELAALALANICEGSWATQRDRTRFTLPEVKERWLALARALAKVSAPNVRVVLFHQTRNSTALGEELNLDLIVAMAGVNGGGGARHGEREAGNDDDGFHLPEMQLKWALENLTAVLFAGGVPEQARSKVALAHDQVERAWKMLAATGYLPPP